MPELDGFYQKVVKNNNKKQIFRLIRKKKKITKLDLSLQLKLSITTISSNIKEMKEDGLIKESGFEESTGGRKAVVIEYIPDARYSIGVEVKEDHGRVIIIDLDCNIIKEEVFNSIDLLNFESSMISILKNVIENSGLEDKLLGIGISLPGTINIAKNILESAPNMGLHNVDLNTLCNFFDVPVYIDNEANCSAYGEYEFREIENEDLFFVSITEGIGGAIIINKKLYNGKDHRAGEVGHITINFEGENCSCGNKGCWECYGSLKALGKIYKRNTGKELKMLKNLFENLDSGEVKEVLKTYAGNIAIGIRNLLMIFDPSYIIIGGEICHFENVMLPQIKKYVFKNNDFYSENDVEILFSGLRGNSGIMGAALSVIDLI